MKKYRRVAQRDRWGCGVACVASLLGVSYDKAKADLVAIKGKDIDSRPYGLSLRALAKAVPGHRATYEQAQSVSRWPVGTVVFLSEVSGRYKGSGHYLLKTPEGWMDPMFNGDEEKAKAGFRARLPRGTAIQAALVPGSH